MHTLTTKGGARKLWWAAAVLVTSLAGAFAATLAIAPQPAQAAKSGSCANNAFTLVLPDGSKITGPARKQIPASKIAGGKLRVVGKFVEFTVDADTFTVTDYTLTGARSDRDVTGGQRTPIFASKVPQAAQLIGIDTDTSRWSVAASGRMGMVVGEDALEPLNERNVNCRPV